MNNLKITRFDGSGDINNWLEEFELNKLIFKWTEDDLKLIIPASLTGPAKTYYIIKKADLDTYEKFKDGIKKEFSKISFRSLKKAVESRKQKSNENFGNYCLEMFKLCKEWRDDIKDEEIINYIFDGCNSILRNKLSSHLDLNFNDFMKKGKILEELLEKEVNVIQNPKYYNHIRKSTQFNNDSRNSSFQTKKNNLTYFQNNNFRRNNITQPHNKNNYQNNNSGNKNRNVNDQKRNSFQNRNNNWNNKSQKKTWKKRTNLLEEGEQNSSDEEYRVEKQFEETCQDNVFEDETNLLISSETGILRAKIKLNNNLSTVVLDTGSSVSLINEEFLNKLKIKFDKVLTKISTVNSTHLNVFGKTNISLEIDKKQYLHEFLIADFKYPVLIGMDFLEKNNFMIDLQNKTLSQIPLRANLISENKEIDSLISKYSSIFNDNPSSPAKLEPFQIKLTSDKCKNVVYRTSQYEDEIISQEVKKMLEYNIIRKSKSNFCFPVILVKKKDNTFRFCIDFRNLNKITVKDSFPLPRIDEMLAKLGNSTYFSKLDCSSGYWQIKLNENDKYKTAFKTKEGLFEFNVLPFGLANAPSHFQRVMNEILEPYSKFSSVYLDDVIVFSNTLEEHLIHLDKIFNLFMKVNLRLKLKKCEFSKTKIEYLGHSVSKGQIYPLISKVHAIENAKPPTNIKELQQFLGIINYYRKFIPNLSQKASPLYELLKKEKEFVFKEKELNAFNLLRNFLITEPIFLKIPNFNLPFELATDASNEAIGAILSQNNQVVEYASRSLNTTEKNYSTTEKELLAIIFGIEHFRYYLLGRKFKIITDHNPLKFLDSVKQNSKLIRWKLKLAEYDYEIVYKPGKEHGNVDYLSRVKLETNFLECYNLDQQQLEKIKELQTKDEELQKLFKEKKLQLISGILFECSNGKRLAIPKLLREEILQLNHNHKLSGHLGIKKTFNRIKSIYYWPKMKNSVILWINSCIECNKKDYKSQQIGKLNPLKIPSELFEQVGMDICGPLPKSKNGNEYILVITEYLSRYAEAFPLSNIGSKTITQIFIKNIVLKHGVPQKILTDRGTNFMSDFMIDFYELLDIKKLTTSSYHPQTNALTERFNRTLASMLTPFVNENKDNWDDLLPYILFSYNTSTQESTKLSPFEVLYGGRKPKLPQQIDFNEEKLELESMLEKAEIVKNIAKKNLISSQTTQKKYYDQKHKDIEFEEHDLVMLKDPTAKKLDPKYIGPFRILQKINKLNYKIELPSGSRMNDVIHISRLKRISEIKDPQLPENSKSPSSQLKNEMQYEIEEILDKKFMKSNDGKRRLYYLIKWKGYSLEHNTWEPKSELGNAKEIIKEFEKRRKKAK